MIPLHSSSSSSSSSSQRRPVHILILSSWRSGSSFLGQIFNHHPDVFYIFEPGYPVWIRFQQENVELLHYPLRDLLHSLFTCDVSPLLPYLPHGGQRISEFVFFAESRALCSPPACLYPITSEGYDRSKCSVLCGSIPVKKMADTCVAYSHVVIKTVRILDINVLIPLLRDHDLDLRILHLVRDPRAVASSRNFFSLLIDDKILIGSEEKGKKNSPTITQVMGKICNAQVAINKVAKAVGSIFHGRYLVIRHEDLAMEPNLSVKRIYDFAGLTLTEDLKNWVYTITHDKDEKNDGHMKYSKESRKVVQNWRRNMDFHSVMEVQQSCQVAMKHFGYLLVESEKDQKNLTMDLLVDRWTEEDVWTPGSPPSGVPCLSSLCLAIHLVDLVQVPLMVYPYSHPGQGLISTEIGHLASQPAPLAQLQLLQEIREWVEQMEENQDIHRGTDRKVTERTHPISRATGREDADPVLKMVPRINYRHLMTVFLLLTFSLTFLLHGSSHINYTQEKRVHILILTSWRSGSSFLGQIFNHHPNVFYLFEPARMVWVKFPGESAEVLHYPVRDLLRSLFSCDMSPLHSYLPRSGRFISDLPFWSESQALCSPPACTALDPDDGYDRPTCFRRCGHAPLKNMSESCKAHSHVVMKVVRVLDLGTLLPLFRDPTLDLRILHLVRDPRAVAASRMNFIGLDDEDVIVTGGREAKQKRKSDPKLTQVMNKICRAQVAINEFARLARTSLQGRYMMIRHEDLARQPMYSVQKIYSFAGLKLTAELEKWVHNVTHQWGPEEPGFFNFAGVSREIVQKWRKNLNYTTVMEIQKECKEALEVFGYSPVRSLKEQKDLTFDIIKDIEMIQHV
ncbi:uncharacterized protein WCC33_014915 [Rhinophrynus dorsalis]